MASIYDNPLLAQYLKPQAVLPPALVPPQAKKNWQDKLGAFLIQGDANWQPDDATRRQMVKKGLLEAGLSMLANPTGYGNSPVAGISGGLLRGVQQMNAEAADLRGRTIGINGNVSPARIRELDQAAQRMGLKVGTPAYNEFMQRQYGGLPKASNMSEWTTKVTESGEIYRTNEMGGLQYFDKAQRKFVDMENSQEPDRKVVMDAPVNEPDDIIANAEIKRRLEAGLPVNFKVVDGKVVDLPSPPSRIVTDRPLPNLGKPIAPKAQTRAMSPQEIASYGLPAGTSATIDSNGSVNVLNKPPVEPKKQADANVVKQAAQLPSLLRRIQRVSDASKNLGFAGVDGGPIDQAALRFSPSGQELESAVGQLRAMLLPFVRVPGVGSQSDLEARLDALQYPDASQPPAVRKRNIDELNAFVKDLSDVYTTMIKGGQTPDAPAGNDDDLINKYLSK